MEPLSAPRMTRVWSLESSFKAAFSGGVRLGLNGGGFFTFSWWGILASITCRMYGLVEGGGDH